MASDDPRLIALAADIANDTPVQWASTIDDPAHESVRGVVVQLARLAAIGSLHRKDLPLRSRDCPTHALCSGTLPAREGQPTGFTLGTWQDLTLLERVGAGSFGEVFRAFDPRLEREVALKLLWPDAGLSPEQALQEARLLARVRHPNVVTVYGAAVDHGIVGFWMDLVRGRTLAERLRTEGPVPCEEVRRIAIALSDAVSAVHGAGLLHRDIKAENVMETHTGGIVLMDFGAGQPRMDHPSPEYAGTPLYLAPEVFQGASASVRSDVYSIGVLLYALVTGRYPVTARSMEELLAAHAQPFDRWEKSLVSPFGKVPRALRQTITTALASAPADRFQRSDEIGRSLAGARRWPGAMRTVLLLLTLVGAGGLGLLNTGFPKDAAALADARPARLPFLRIDNTFFLPKVSRDGTQVVFSHGPDELVVAELSSGRARHIPVPRLAGSEEQYVYDGVISRDGRHVAYTSYSRRRQRGWLRVADVAGGTSRTIIDEDRVSFVQALDWSDDSTTLLLQIGRANQRPTLATLDVANGRLQTIVELHGSVADASLSPDGRHAVTDETDPEGIPQLTTVELATGLRSELLKSQRHNSNPVWLDDSIVFVGNGDNGSALWSVPVAAGQPLGPPRLLVDNLGPILPWGIDSHGALIYSPRTGPSRILHAGFDEVTGRLTTEPQPLSEGPLETWSPAWSPDGESLAFFRATGFNRPEATLHIRHLGSGSEQTRQIPSGEAWLLAWSGDGRRLAWLAPQVGSRRIRVMDLANGSVSTAKEWFSVRRNWEALSMTWLPGTASMVVADDDRVYRIDTDAPHNEQTVFRAPSGRVLVPGIVGSTEGRFVMFAVQDAGSQVELLALPTQGGSPRVLWRTDPGRLSEVFSRSPNGRFVLVSAAQQKELADLDPHVLSAWDSSNGTQRVMSMGSRFSDVSVSPRGNRVAWTSGRFISMSQPVRVSPGRQDLAFGRLGGLGEPAKWPAANRTVR